MKTRFWRHAVAPLLVLGAVVCAVAELHRAPPNGLMLTRFSDTNFKTPVGPPELDSRIYFSSDDGWHPVPSWLKDETAARWEGYVDAPREGDYVFHLTSDDSGWLDLDGVRHISMPGRHGPQDQEVTVNWKKGFHRIKIEYIQFDHGAELKLQWRLPSGYNRIGLMPVTMLHPTEAAGPTPMDRLLRWLTSLLLLAALAWLARGRLGVALGRLRDDPASRRRAAAGVFVFALVLGVRLIDLSGEGETCDEWAYQGAATVYAHNVAGGDFDPDQWEVNREHPAVGKLLYAYGQYNFGDAQATERVFAVVLNAFTALLAFLVALRLFGVEVAVLTGIVLALLPSFVAHGKIPALDCPATFFHALAMWLFIRGLHDRSQRTSSFTWLLVVTGLAVATKLTNALLVVFFVGIPPLLQWRRVRETGALSLPVAIYLLPFLAGIPFVLTWPWLWGNFMPHITETLNHWAYHPPELFRGDLTSQPPRYYFLVAFAATTPVALAPFFFTGIAQAFRRTPPPVLRSDDDGEITDRAWWLLLIAWFILPFLWSFAGLLQDGIRYVYAAFLPFAILTGAGAAIVVAKIRAWAGAARWSRFAFPTMGLAIGGYLAAACASVHPFYLDYFNEVSGGAGHVYQTRFLETSWWGEGLNRARDWLNAHAESNASYRLQGMVGHTFIGLRDDLRSVSGGGDYVVRTDFSPGDEGVFGYSEAYMLRVQGAPLVGVYKKGSAEGTAPQPDADLRRRLHHQAGDIARTRP